MEVDHTRILERTLLVFFCFSSLSSTELASENAASDSSSFAAAALRLTMARVLGEGGSATRRGRSITRRVAVASPVALPWESCPKEGKPYAPRPSA